MSPLSTGLGTKFVKVDCYDSPDGPVFGEFTFASGGDDTGMLRYSPQILAQLDRAMNGEEVGALSGFDIDLQTFRKALDRGPTVKCDPIQYSRMSVGAVQGDRRYAPLLAAGLASGASRPVFTLGAHMIGYLNGDESRAFAIQDLVRKGSRAINGTSRLGEFETKALAFHDPRAGGNPWHTARAAEVRLAAGDLTALDVLRSLAAEGYQHAARVLSKRDDSEPV